MRRFTLLILLIALLISGCTNKQDRDTSTGILFYYCQETKSDEITEAVMAAERFDNNLRQHTVMELLEIYMKGPTTDDLVSPFPKDASIVSLEILGTRVKIALCHDFSKLTEPQKIVACGCLAQTVMNITGHHSVEISIDGAFIFSEDSITIRSGDIVFSDAFKIN